MSDSFLKISKGVSLTPQPSEPLNPVNGNIYYDQSLQRFRKYENGAWSNLGSGAGGGLSYFSDRESNIISKLDLYNDGVSQTPTDGIGGVINTEVTKALNTTTPLISNSSYRFSKDANNRQGFGFSITTDIPLDKPVIEGECITVQFRYRTSVNYVSGDIKMFYYLVGPNQLFALNGVDNLGVFGNNLNRETGDRGQFTATLNAVTGTTAIRIIGHIATMSTLAYDLDIDEITIGTASTLTAPIVEYIGQVTPTLSWTGGIASNIMNMWRRGDRLLVQGRVAFNAAPTPSTNFAVTLPNGWTVDTTKSQSFNTLVLPGSAYLLDSGVREYVGATRLASSNQFGIVHTESGNAGFVNNTNPFAFGADDIISYTFEAPITQFANSSNIISSTQAQFLSGSFRASRNGTNQTGVNPDSSVVKINFNSTSASIDYQRGGLVYDTANSRFVATKPVRLAVSTVLRVLGTNVLNNGYAAIINVNGTERISGSRIFPVAGAGLDLSCSGNLNLAAGDIVEVALLGIGNNSSSPLTVDGTPIHTYFEAQEIPDLSVVGIAGTPLEVLSATSAEKTPVASNHYLQMTGNSLTLGPGVYELSGLIEYRDTTGSNTNISSVRADFFGANGADSNSTPASLTSLAGLTRLTSNDEYFDSNSNLGSRQQRAIASYVISLTQTQTIFLVIGPITVATPANARFRVRANSRRLR